jgi:succinate dehydrogenase/fumarate reductase flavoprotein subunit
LSEGSRIAVVGAGGAGLCAAIAAREAGADVLLVSKTRLGMANCTAYAGGGFTAPVGGFTPAEHKALTWAVGRGLNENRLVEAVSEGAEAAFARLREWGVVYDTRRGGISVRPGSLSRKLGGTGMTLPLVEHARKIGIEAREGVVATAVLRSDGGQGRAAGVELYDPGTGKASREPASAVIIATGGGGAAFPRTDNPIRTTGDGYRLLLAAGVDLFDMEFVQWYPLGYADPGFPIWMISLPTVDQVPLENSDGERFYDKLLAEWGLANGIQANLYARDRSAVAIATECKAGREVLLRYDLADPERLAAIDPLAAGKFASIGGPRPVSVAPLVHYFCGGAVASADGVTAVPGLFACGEVVGGFDGANRAGGNALTAVTVLSQRTGGRAARYAGGAKTAGATEVSEALACGSVAELAAAWAQNVGNRIVPAPTGAVLRQRIQSAIGEGIGVLRSEAGISGCLRELESLGRMVADLAPESARDRLVAIECLNILSVGSLVATAARERTESRGGHFREDHPAEDPGWRRHIVLSAAGPQGAAEAPLGLSIKHAAVGEVTPE